MTTQDRDQPTLPGLEPPAPTDVPLVKAAKRSIAALAEANLLGEQHALPCALVLALADAVESGRRGGKAAAVAMAAAQLRETWLTLPEPGGGESGDGWDQLAEELRRAAQVQHAAESDAS